MRDKILLFAILMTCLVGWAPRSSAQTPTGTLQGTVTDPTGAAVPEATVTITNSGTNETRTLKSDSTGRYVQPFLTPGTYTVAVQASGFRTAKEDNVKIDISQNRSVDFALVVGQISEQVEVHGTQAPLDTNSATLGQVIAQRTVVDLPLNGRNPLSLAELVPTVSNVGGASTPHIGGSRNAINEEQLDGVSNILPENNVGNTTAAYTPIVDSVQEFSVQTNALNAEYGRFGGGVINLVTKSGNNEFHGSLFNFTRNTVLNANDFFSNRAGEPESSTVDNQYGGVIGGPIWIPKVYNGHNKSFFFFGFQGYDQTNAANVTDTVPVAAFRTGNFSSLGTTIYDPLTVSYNAGTGQYVRQPFAGNMVPSSRFNPVAVNAMSYFPQPNTGGAGAQTNNFIAVGSTFNNSYQWDSRLDHDFSEKWRMFFRLSHSWGSNNQLEDYGNAASQGGGGPTAGGAWSASMDHTITFSPTLVADFRYGLSRSYVTRTPYDSGFNPSTLGFPSYLSQEASARVLEFPRFNFSNGAGLGNTGWVDLIENPMSHNFTGNLTKIIGNHSIKFGGEFRKLFINFSQYGFPDGDFNFDQTWTQQILSASNGTGSPYASFLLGFASSGQITQEPTAADASAYMGWYVQDDWKVTSKLTLNLGLRWEVEFPRTERYNRLSYWDPNLPSPLEGKVPASACLYCGDLMGQMEFVGQPNSEYGRAQGPTQWKGIGPRLGVAYNATPKTVIRSGFGIVYAPSALEAAGTSGAQGMEGFTVNTQMLTTTNNQQSAFATLSNPFPSGFVQVQGAAGGPGTDIGNGIGESFFDSYRNPYSIEWNFNIQQQLPGQITAEIGYLGNRGLYLVNGDPGSPYSQLPPGDLALGNQLLATVNNPFYGLITTPGSPLSASTITYNQLLSMYPQYNGVMSFRKPTANSIYHGLTVRLDKRFSHGLLFTVAFTGSKTMDNSAAAVTYLGPTSGTYINQYNGALEWSVSPQDVSRSVVSSFVYDLPFGKGKALLNSAPRVVNALVSGWQVNGILTFQDGTPIVLQPAINQTGIFALGQTPDNTGHSAAISNPSINQWFNTAVFYQPPPFTFGNTSRSLPNVRNPGVDDADLSLFKNNYLGSTERYNLQLRIEAFNAINHPQFGSPNTSIQAGSGFGTISYDANPNRQVQLAVKFLW